MSPSQPPAPLEARPSPVLLADGTAPVPLVGPLPAPLDPAGAPAAPGPASAAPGAPGARLPVVAPASGDDRAVVLVVDDEELLRVIAERVLGMAGYRVLLAASGEEALALATDPALRIDLLFTDIVMPGIHGPALAAALREFRPGLRVLVASGFAPDESDREGLGLGDLPFLPKPYTPHEVTATVGRILASVPS